MKVKVLNRVNMLIAFILGVLGVTGCNNIAELEGQRIDNDTIVRCMYGVPSPMLDGSVITEDNPDANQE